MSAKLPRVPKLGLHRGTGQGRCVIRGVTHYLGKYGSAECNEAYRRLLGEYLTGGIAPPPARKKERERRQSTEPLICELVPRYLEFVGTYYVKNGSPTSEQPASRSALAELVRSYGSLPVSEFGPLKLMAVRDAMARDVLDNEGKVVRKGWSRSTINGAVARIRRFFKWCVEREMVPPSVLHGLQSVSGLRKGRTQAREPEPIAPVPDGDVDAIVDSLPGPVRAMVELQRLTGCRPGEIVTLCPGDVDTARDVWEFVPQSHKTEHHGKGRVVLIGPKAQKILAPYLANRKRDQCCFSPREAEAERSKARRASRKTRVQPSQKNRRTKNRTRPLRESYDVASYRRAIRRACEKAEVPIWHPNQLRHAAGTRFRQSHGMEAARVALGHSSPDTTAIYAERDLALARTLALEVG